MSTPQKSTPQNLQSSSGSTLPSESWVMKALDDLREDMKTQHGVIDKSLNGVAGKLDTLDTRLAKIETRISRLIWVVGTVGTIVTLIWGGYEILTGFVDVNISFTAKK